MIGLTTASYLFEVMFEDNYLNLRKIKKTIQTLSAFGIGILDATDF